MDAMIVIIDYGLGNIGSLKNMINKIGHASVVSGRRDDIMKADRLLLPGVGPFDEGMTNLNKLGLVEILNEKVIEHRTPILGICLGMQLFSQRSAEGKLNGIGWLPAKTEKFSFNADRRTFKVPHMGWNTVSKIKEDGLFNGMSAAPRYYFVHSYHLVCYDQVDIIGVTNYGYDFVSAVRRNNITGVQFHPEKSHKYGMHLLKNFIETG